MKPIAPYSLITETSRHDPNPGDILIGRGIEYLLRQFEEESGRYPVFNHIGIFRRKEICFTRCTLESETVVLCGTPQLGTNVPIRFDQWFYDQLWKWKDQGKKILNLWPGFCAESYRYSEDQAVDYVIERNRAFIERNMPVYDLIVPRDGVTQRSLAACGFETKQLIDSVSYAKDYYGIEPQFFHRVNNPIRGERIQVRGRGVVTVRKLDPVDRMVPALQRAADFLMEREEISEVIFLCHDNTDYEFYRGLNLAEKTGFKMICINQPRDLVEFYSGVSALISIRVHGSVLAANFGAAVINVRMDSRSSILDFLGVESLPLDEFLGEEMPGFRIEFSVDPEVVAIPQANRIAHEDLFKTAMKKIDG